MKQISKDRIRLFERTLLTPFDFLIGDDDEV